MILIDFIKKKYDLFVICIFYLWILSCLLLVSDELRFIKGLFSIVLTFIASIEILVRKRIPYILAIGVLGFLGFFMIYSFFSELCFTGMNFTAIQIYWMTPVCSFLIASLFYSHKRLYYLEKFFIVLIGILLFYNYWFILESLNILPKFVSVLQPKALFAMEGTIMFARTGSEGSYSFFLPAFFYLFIIRALKGNSSKLLLSMLLLSVLFIAICGRRILTFVCVTSFIFILLNKVLNEPNALKKYLFKERKLFICLFIVLVIFFILNFDFFVAIFTTFYEAFRQLNNSNSARVYKYVHLMEGWFFDGRSFLFGNGLINELGRHEWVYLALGFQTGVIGLLFCMLTVVMLLWSIYIKIITNPYFEKINIAITIGFICFLISGGTNPMVTQLWAWTLILIPLIPRKNIVIHKEMIKSLHLDKNSRVA